MGGGGVHCSVRCCAACMCVRVADGRAAFSRGSPGTTDKIKITNRIARSPGLVDSHVHTVPFKRIKMLYPRVDVL